jgi:hypothetical protein
MITRDTATFSKAKKVADDVVDVVASCHVVRDAGSDPKALADLDRSQQRAPARDQGSEQFLILAVVELAMAEADCGQRHRGQELERIVLADPDCHVAGEFE